MKYKAYKNWKTQTGTPVEVWKIKQLGYVNDSHGKIAKFNSLSGSFIGERWICREVESLIFKTYIFKVEDDVVYEDDDIGWSYTPLKDVIVENSPNSIADPYEAWLNYCKDSNYRFAQTNFKNKTVARLEKLDTNKAIILNKLESAEKDKNLKKFFKAYYAFLKTPSMYTLRKFNQFKGKYLEVRAYVNKEAKALLK